MIELIKYIQKIDFKSNSDYLKNIFWLEAAANWPKNIFWLEAAAINGAATVLRSFLKSHSIFSWSLNFQSFLPNLLMTNGFLSKLGYNQPIYTFLSFTVAAPLIAAASNQKIFSGQFAAASIQERPLIKKYFYIALWKLLKSTIKYF